MIRYFSGITVLLLLSGVSLGQNDPLADWLISKSVHPNGVCSIPRCGDGKLAIAMAKAGFIVHGMDSVERVDVIKKAAIDAGVIGRTVYLQKGSLASIPLADYSIDLLVITDATKADLTDAVRKEIIRVISPCIGRAVVGRAKSAGAGDLNKAALETWVKDPALANAEVTENDKGLWATFGRPALEGADDWTHWYHGADNNPVSTDKAFTAPFQVAWLGRPFFAATRSTSRVAVKGRIFEASDNSRYATWWKPSPPPSLTAKNAYNGHIIWKKDLSKNYHALRSTIIADGEFVYIAEGATALILAAATGTEIGKIDFSQAGPSIKWLGLSEGILVALCGVEDGKGQNILAKENWQEKKLWFGTGISAYSIASKKNIWSWTEPTPIDCRAIGISEGRIFYWASGVRAGCLSLNDGKLLWANDKADTVKLIDENESAFPFGSITPRAGMICTKDAVYFSCSDKKNLVALSAKDGSLMWSVVDDGSLALPSYFDGKIFSRGVKGGILDALTGKPPAKKYPQIGLGGGCGVTTFSANFLCRQAGGITFDIVNNKTIPGQPLKDQCYLGSCITQGLFLYTVSNCGCPVMHGYVVQSPIKTPLPEGNSTEGRLEVGSGDIQTVAALKTDKQDWFTFRGGNRRMGSTAVAVPEKPRKVWSYDLAVPYPIKKTSDETEYWPTAPVSAGGLIFYGGADGRITCLDVKDGKPKWTFFTQGPILASPAVWEGRVYTGSADGYVYALEATTGRLLWRFRAAPIERNIMAYGYLQSSWPVISGIIVEDGTIYFVAGFSVQPKAYAFALDALTGKVKWQNGDAQRLKGDDVFTPCGNMASFKGKLWLRTFHGGSGGASFDMKDGKMDPMIPTGGLGGSDIGILKDRFIIYGGGEVYRDLDFRVAYRDSKIGFMEIDSESRPILPDSTVNNSALLSPVWNDSIIILCGIRGDADVGMTEPQCWDVDKSIDFLSKINKDVDIKKLQFWQLAQLPQTPKGILDKPPMRVWGPLPLDINSMALAGNAVVITSIVKKGKNPGERSYPAANWKIGLYKLTDGSVMWEEPLASEPAEDGLCIDRDGNICVTLRNGGAVCFGK